ncbi:MAG: hypothetical protein ACP5XB_31530, partial [Isosphaeraceae bacterium]
MPVDHRLEELGRRWASSNSPDYRELAPRALQPFKSEKNIAILKKLLTDTTPRDYIDGKGGGTRSYPARLPAYVILKSWGVPAKEPVTEVPLHHTDTHVREPLARANSPCLVSLDVSPWQARG